MNEEYVLSTVERFLFIQEKVREHEANLETAKKHKQRSRLWVNIVFVITVVLIVLSFLITPFLFTITPLLWAPIIAWVDYEHHDSEINHAEEMLNFCRERLYEISQQIIEEF